jgi:hypothetical protein
MRMITTYLDFNTIQRNQHVRDEKCTQNFGRKAWRDETTWKTEEYTEEED